MQRRIFLGESAAIVAGLLSLRDSVAQAKLPVVGYLIPTAPLIAPVATAFRQGLSDAGYVEGQNASIEYRWADGDYDRLAALAADLVGRNVDIIAAVGGISALAAKNATSTIPIIFSTVGDPVGSGLVASLARPDGNVTGFSNMTAEMTAKRLELLSELVPQAG